MIGEELVRFSLLGIDVTLSRAKRDQDKLELSDIKVVNQETITYIKNLAKEDINRRISSVSRSSTEDLDSLKQCLDHNGIVVIPDFIPELLMKRVSPIIASVRDAIARFIQSDDSLVEEPTVLFQKGTAKLNGYQALSSHEKSVVQVRRGQDQGMVDIFNVDRWKQELGEVLRPYFEDPKILEIMRSDSEQVRARNLNLYVNSNVDQTRGFHVDSYSRQLKGFIYLEDCISLDDGPYTYVKGSHRPSAYTKLNKHVSSVLPNLTETPSVPLENILPVLAKKGSLVISDQGGSHRGFPQSNGHNRVVAVMNYK
ncbi:hypothetical protein MDG893_01235 [Marinobacter algicola DG893]|uniref:Phytanoyl-CoA dioxygenase n=1 Tax=Marinobacter algicola DG893 TaxID=443152 RepID=A6F1I7_9GAMM|nr:hypothetical protein MDG893_01235 [Marinobacter algicola DG893]